VSDEPLSDDGDDTASQSVDEAEDTGDALAEGDIGMEDFVADTGLPRLKPGQKVVQSMGPDGKIISQIIDPPKPPKLSAVDTNAEVFEPHIEGSEDMTPEQLQEASYDAATSQYSQKYANQEAVQVSDVLVGGVEMEKQIYDDGAVWLVSDDTTEPPLRQHNETKEQKRDRETSQSWDDKFESEDWTP
jgi:hypothetical protein